MQVDCMLATRLRFKYIEPLAVERYVFKLCMFQYFNYREVSFTPCGLMEQGIGSCLVAYLKLPSHCYRAKWQSDRSCDKEDSAI
jgi:hypothetical protein